MRTSILFGLTLSALVGCSSGNVSIDNGTDPLSPDGDKLPDGGASSSSGGGGGSSSGSPAEGQCGAGLTLCMLGEACSASQDCASNACSDSGKCVERPSCVHHFGSDTCGQGEVGSDSVKHESCCESTEVIGFTDVAHPGKKVLLDRYEISAGRMRAFVEAMSAKYNGNPDLKSYAASNTPAIWNPIWNSYLPSSAVGGTLVIDRMLLGDPRHLGQSQAQAGPGVILVPDANKNLSMGINTQFSGFPMVEIHGENCGTYAGSYGSPTYYFPPDVQKANGEVARVDARGYQDEVIPAQEWLDVKAMNCASNEIMQLFCQWDTNGEGELMTGEVFDFITQTPKRAIDVGGCGTQLDNHGALLGEDTSSSVFSGGRCPDLLDASGNPQIVSTFDAGDHLGPANLNRHVYHYPNIDPDKDHTNSDDKTWQVAAPGRVKADFIALPGQSNGWYDLAGNMGESVLDTNNGKFSGLFSIRGRGLGTGSQHSDEAVFLLSNETVRRIQRPEAKSYNLGGRCVRFK